MCVIACVGPQYGYWESADGMCSRMPAVYEHRRFAMGVLVQGRAEEERSALGKKWVVQRLPFSTTSLASLIILNPAAVHGEVMSWSGMLS